MSVPTAASPCPNTSRTSLIYPNLLCAQHRQCLCFSSWSLWQLQLRLNRASCSEITARQEKNCSQLFYDSMTYINIHFLDQSPTIAHARRGVIVFQQPLLELFEASAQTHYVTTRIRLTERAAVPENSPSMARKSASSIASYTLLRLSLKSAVRGKSTPEATGLRRPPRPPAFPPAARGRPRGAREKRRRPEIAASPGRGSGVTGEHRAQLGTRSRETSESRRSLTASDHLHPSPAPARPEPGAQTLPPSASGTGPAPPLLRAHVGPWGAGRVAAILSWAEPFLERGLAGPARVGGRICVSGESRGAVDR